MECGGIYLGLLFQMEEGGGLIGGFLGMIIQLAIAVLMIASLWVIFTKAGIEGWKSIIPIYNVYCILQIVGRPGWWLLLYFIPIVNLVIAILVNIELAKSFGKSAAFGIGLIFLAPIFYPILAFSEAQYSGPVN